MIFFRADGNSQIGAGHVMRCLSIADAAVEIGEEPIFYTAGDEFSKTIQDRKIHNIVLGTDFMKMESELLLLKKEILEHKPTVIFVDSYYVTKKYLWSVMKYCHSYGGKVAYIDDVLSFAYPCDYLINYNIFGPDKKMEYIDMYESAGLIKDNEGYPKFLLGINYVPLRKEFCNLPARVVRNNPRNVLVSTGGADTAHIALDIVRNITALPDSEIGNLKFHILIGAMNEDKTEIEQLAVGCANIELHYNVKDMLGLMQMCDVAISAAGSTLYELCATQTPMITYVVAENQIAGAEGFDKLGIAEYVGDVRDIGVDNLVKRMLNASMEIIHCSKKMEQTRITQKNLSRHGAMNILEKCCEKPRL